MTRWGMRVREFYWAFRAALAGGRIRACVQPEWTQDDAAALQTFLRTHTGRRLVAVLDWQRCERAAIAVSPQPDGGHAYAAGRAAGMNEWDRIFMTLSAVRPASDKPEEAAQGAPDILEGMAP